MVFFVQNGKGRDQYESADGSKVNPEGDGLMISKDGLLVERQAPIKFFTQQPWGCSYGHKYGGVKFVYETELNIR